MAARIAYLDCRRLRRGLAAGFDNLIRQRDYLNQINVFPVPDGDTGNNLAHTALAGFQSLTDYSGNNAGELLGNVGDAMLDHAQGNSGTLLAQYFHGAAAAVQTLERISTREFADLLNTAAKDTRNALDDPRDGTILDVIDAAATAAQDSQTDDFAELMPQLAAAANSALEATTARMETLRKAGVVDAGAAGYCAILNGFESYLHSGTVRSISNLESMPDLAPVSHEHAVDLEYRYCTECIVVGEQLESAAVRTLLKKMGNSLVLAGSSRRLKVHVHTNDPEQVFRELEAFGRLERCKADDMHSQARTLEKAGRSTVVMTDTASDLADDLLEKLGISLVPLRVTMGERVFLDKTGISADEFRSELDKSLAKPGTSQPSQGDLRRMFEFLGTHFANTIYVSLSSQLSGTYRAGQTAANEANSAGKLTLVDSRNASVGQGLIVKRAAELADAGLAADSIVAELNKLVEEVQTFALVTDLRSAVRSGRLKPWVERVASVLRITPVLGNAPDGSVSVTSFFLGHADLTHRFAQLIKRRAIPQDRWEIALACGGQSAAAGDQLERELRELFSADTTLWRTDIGPAFGVHAGMDALVVALRPLA